MTTLPADIKQQINNACWGVVDHYLALNIEGKKIRTPYFMNISGFEFARSLEMQGIPKEKIWKIKEIYNTNQLRFGWYQGKGTPKEIEHAVHELARMFHFDLHAAHPKAIEEFMKFAGIGIDCAGLVIQTLSISCGSVGSEYRESLFRSLAWIDPNFQIPRQAGCIVFDGDASVPIAPHEIRPLDVLLFRGEHRASHMALVLERNKQMYIVQSAFTTNPSGVTVFPITVENRNIHFSVKTHTSNTWDGLYAKGVFEFRRLKYFS